MTDSYRPWFACQKHPDWFWAYAQEFHRAVYDYYDREGWRESAPSDTPNVLKAFDVVYRLARRKWTDKDGFIAYTYKRNTGPRRISRPTLQKVLTWLVNQEIILAHPDNGTRHRLMNRFKLNTEWDADGGKEKREAHIAARIRGEKTKKRTLPRFPVVEKKEPSPVKAEMEPRDRSKDSVAGMRVEEGVSVFQAIINNRGTESDDSPSTR